MVPLPAQETQREESTTISAVLALDIYPDALSINDEVFYGKPLELASTVLRTYFDPEIVKRAEIDFGVRSDPFYPFKKKFHLSLKLLETLAQFSPKQLHITTCSPVIVVAAPILIGLGKRAQVTLRVPKLSRGPKAMEIINAARALREVGITTRIER